ncbi:MAG: transcriptional regulator BetI [Rhodospirillaceae bacterium]|nr:transcriptional regulator BetI [Rhodospirillaceae bacterium]
MPKLGMAAIRRRQLVDATIKSIHAYGFHNTTIQTIGHAAGLSPGIIHHYFGGKDELLAATMRSLLDELRDDHLARLHAASGPAERIDAILVANFDPKQFRPEILAAWLAFWAQAPFFPLLRRLRRLYTRRTLTNLRVGLRALVAADRVDAISLTLMAQIDGFWLRAAQGDADVTAERALASVRQTIADAVPAARPGPAVHTSPPLQKALHP